MSNYAARGATPTTLTAAEQTAVLRASGEKIRDERDHLIIGFALGCGLREHEIAALKVVDVVTRGTIRRRVRLRVFKGHRRRRSKGPPPVEFAVIPDELRRKLGRYVERMGAVGTAPLFPSRQGGGGHLTTRMIRYLWEKWQERAQLERRHPFHRLRHTFVTAVFQASGRDIIAAKRMARHRKVETTEIYAHVGDEELEQVARKLRC